MSHHLWFKGIGKVEEPGLVEFMNLWNESSIEARVEFLKQHVPHLYLFEVEEFSHRHANQLPRGALVALVGLFEGILKVDPDF